MTDDTFEKRMKKIADDEAAAAEVNRRAASDDDADALTVDELRDHFRRSKQ